MFITNSITKLLNFKDENLIFDENFLEEQNINNKRCLVIKGYLFNKFDYCPKCRFINLFSILNIS